MGGYGGTSGGRSESKFGNVGDLVVRSSNIARIEAHQAQTSSEFSKRIGLHSDVEGILERLILSHAKFTLCPGRLGGQLIFIWRDQLRGEFNGSRVQEC